LHSGAGATFFAAGLGAFGRETEGISWIRSRVKGLSGNRRDSMHPYYLAFEAEALHLANRISEALKQYSMQKALLKE